MNGVVVIDKPKGLTSHDVVQQARTILGVSRIGHTGTLDPLATGVLVLCVGKATRIARYLEADDKEYRAELRLGVTTDTLDADGRVLAERSYRMPTVGEISSVLDCFLGTISQRPPAYSALKVQGVAAHRLARAGKVPDLPERSVTVHAISLSEYHDPLLRFSVHCSKGTYVRSLAADIGERLGAGAHLTALARTRSGAFTLAQAITLERLADLAREGIAERAMTSLSDALQRLPLATLTSGDLKLVGHGNAIPFARPDGAMCQDTRIRMVDVDGRLVAVGKQAPGVLRPEVVLL